MKSFIDIDYIHTITKILLSHPADPTPYTFVFCQALDARDQKELKAQFAEHKLDSEILPVGDQAFRQRYAASKKPLLVVYSPPFSKPDFTNLLKASTYNPLYEGLSTQRLTRALASPSLRFRAFSTENSFIVYRDQRLDISRDPRHIEKISQEKSETKATDNRLGATLRLSNDFCAPPKRKQMQNCSLL